MKRLTILFLLMLLTLPSFAQRPKVGVVLCGGGAKGAAHVGVLKVLDLATYAKPHTFPAGIAHVFVNGVHTIKDGAHTGELAGVVLGNEFLSR